MHVEHLPKLTIWWAIKKVSTNFRGLKSQKDNWKFPNVQRLNGTCLNNPCIKIEIAVEI